MLTDDEVRAIRERAEAATPGPWTPEYIRQRLFGGLRTALRRKDGWGRLARLTLPLWIPLVAAFWCAGVLMVGLVLLAAMIVDWVWNG